MRLLCNSVNEEDSIVSIVNIEETDSPFELAKKINDFNKDLANQSVPGGSINVVSVSDTSVGLRRTFDRPIAVGARGLIMQIKIRVALQAASELFITFLIYLVLNR